MFEVGDKVMVNCFHNPKVGIIVEWYFDEGNVWVVNIPGHMTIKCCDNDLAPYRGD